MKRQYPVTKFIKTTVFGWWRITVGG